MSDIQNKNEYNLFYLQGVKKKLSVVRRFPSDKQTFFGTPGVSIIKASLR